MTINKIVLDVLEEEEVQDKIITVIVKAKNTVWTYKEFANAIINHIEDDIAKSIETKIQVVSIDREEVEKILYDCVINNHEEFPVKEILEKYTNKILSLLKPVKPMSREEVDTIITKLVKNLNNIDNGTCEQITGRPTKDWVLNRQNAIDDTITQICNLAKPKLNENILKRGKNEK